MSDSHMQAIAAQFRTPLMQIAQLAQHKPADALEQIQAVTNYAIKMAEVYSWHSTQQQLKLEPLTASSLLYDIAQELDPIAKLYECSVQVRLHEANRPVLGHRQTLKDMLVLLMTGVMQSLPPEQDRQLVLGAHRSAFGTVLGVFSESLELNQQTLTTLRRLRSKSYHPAPTMLAGHHAVSLADQLSRSLQAPLKAFRHEHLPGVGSLLHTSQQLRLVNA